MIVVIPPPAYALDSLESVSRVKGSLPLLEAAPSLGSAKEGYSQGYSGLNEEFDL